MTLPPINAVRVTGTYLNGTGDPQTGYVEFTPSRRLAVDAGGVEVVITPIDVRLPLAADGSFEVELPATDDPTVRPTGWVWHMVERIPGGRTWSFQLPSDVDPVDIVDLVPLDPEPVYVDDYRDPYVTVPYASAASLAALEARVTALENRTP